MLMLHSGHKSGHLEFIFDLFYGICQYFFYYYYVFFYFAWDAWLKDTWLKNNRQLFCFFLVIHFLNWLTEMTMIDNWYDKTIN